MSNAFNKRVRLLTFRKGDMVLAICALIIISRKKGKLEPNCTEKSTEAEHIL